MVPAWKIRAIEALLAEGNGRPVSQRQIAKQLKVWRGTVAAIARKERPDYEALQQQHEEESLEPQTPPARCPGCGCFVFLPCVACCTRAALERKTTRPTRRPDPNPAECLGLDLKDKHRMRYEEVRIRRPKPGKTDDESDQTP
jgi:hypothetical protein